MSGGDRQVRTRWRGFTRRRIAAAVVVLCVIGLGIVYGPRLASGNYHRAAIERLASDAVGRPVTIAGPIELSLLPDPQLRAGTVTIGGPKGGRITAASLRLELAPGPLLLGRLRARRLTLRRPDIVMPWPLPGGALAIAPPPWLASLHAKIVDGTFRLGALRLTHADLSIFTGGPHAVLAASGSVSLAGVAASVVVDVDNTGGLAPAPVSATLRLSGDKATSVAFKGTLDHASVLAGRLTGTAGAHTIAALMPGTKTPASAAGFAADLAADGRMIEFGNIEAAYGVRRLSGSAAIVLRPAPLLKLDLGGTHLPAAAILGFARRARRTVPLAATLNLGDVEADGIVLPKATAVVLADVDGLRVQGAHATLPGGARLTFAGADAESGRFELSAPHPARTVGALQKGFPWLPSLPDNLGALVLGGRLELGTGRIALDGLKGTWGKASHFTGALGVEPKGKTARIDADMAFDRLTLGTGGLAVLRQGIDSPHPELSGPIRLTAREVTIPASDGGGIAATNLLLDAALPGAAQGGGIAIRLATMRLGKALLVGYGDKAANGAITAARVTLTGPDGQETLTTLLHGMGMKPSWLGLQLFHHRFAAALVAAGPAKALRTGITLHLGSLRAAATPTVDLATLHAAGALSLHAPNAASLIGDLGGGALLGARKGLGWPGPGSVSLRAAAFATGSTFGLSDFVASLGGLTASGRIVLATASTPPLVEGRVDADTLALPAPAALLRLARAALASGDAADFPSLSAARVQRDGETVTDNALFGLNLAQGKLAPALTLRVAHAGLAGGVLEGKAVLTGPAAKSPPTLSLRANLKQAVAAQLGTDAAGAGLALPAAIGRLDLGATLNATGAAPDEWRDTLDGNLTLSGSGIVLSGIDLAKAGAALAAAVAAQHPIGGIATANRLRQALAGGQTPFDSLDLSAAIAHGTITLDRAALAGKTGGLGLTGTIDLPHRAMHLTATATPAIAGHKTALGLPIAITGAIARPAVRARVDPAMGWIDTHRPKPKPPAP